MIDENRTMEKYEYYSTDLKPKASKKIVAVCDVCGVVRYPRKCDYRDLCKPCSKIGKNNPFFGKHHTEETKKINSDAHKGKKLTEEHKHKISEAGKNRAPITDETRANMCKAQKGRKAAPMTDEWRHNLSMGGKGKKKPPRTKEHTHKLAEAARGKKRTDEVKQKMSEAHKGEKHWCFGKPRSEEVKQKLSVANTGKMASDESRRKHSATLQGIPYEDWIGFAEREGYCEKFDDACRERIRAKYGHRCFLCGKPQDENITKTNKQRALSVHHFDMNKGQGCNGNLWKLVPLCMHCHGITHTPTWTERIEYLLGYVWE